MKHTDSNQIPQTVCGFCCKMALENVLYCVRLVYGLKLS